MRTLPLPVVNAFLVILLMVLATGCLSWPGSVPVTQQTTAPAVTGSLDCSSSPEGSEIYLDRVYRGTTPSVIADIPTGSHSLEFRLRGYTTWTMNVDVTPGNRSYIHASLSPVTTQTTVPTTVVTTISAQTGPAGCWYYFESDDSGSATLELYENGAGIMTESSEKGGTSRSGSRKISWSYDPVTTVIEFVESNPKDPDHTWSTSMNYDEHEDIIITVGAEGKTLHMDRVACQVG